MLPITTIMELLSVKFGPAGLLALGRIEQLAKQRDLWFVGGTARQMLSPTDGPVKDIDILINTSVPLSRTTLPGMLSESSGGQGAKLTVGGIDLDVFENDIFKWIHGAPCAGDQVAIRHSTGQVLCGPEFLTAHHPGRRNSNWNGPDAYFEEHSKKVELFRGPREAYLRYLCNK